MRTISSTVFAGLVFASVAQPASIEIASTAAYIHGNGALISQLDTGDSGFFSNLDPNNLGTYGWSFTNTTGATIPNFLMFGFLDADIDRDINTFFNEYGALVSLSLPASAPGGAIGATSWQIDEPGFVFGTILSDLAAGSLRNANFVPSSSPDDVSLALGFVIGNLAPGQTASLTLRLSTTSIGGLQQFDPDSNSSFFLNGYATVGQGPINPPSDTPEPSAWALCTAGASAILLLRKRLRGEE